MFGFSNLVPPIWHEFVLQVHLAATCIMVGVIWFVQHVHYPLKHFVHEADFTHYQTQHMQRTAQVVGLPMLVEATLALVLVLDPAIHGQAGLAQLSLALLLGVWLCTAVFQVPLHGALNEGYQASVHQLLLRTNWLRTVLWSSRGGCALFLIP